MALEQLSKSGIVNGQTVQDYHVTQSIDALTGAVGYALTISGSLTLVGTTGSGYFASSLTTDQVRPSNVATNKGYSIPYLAATSSTATLYYTKGQESGGETYLEYNPVTNYLFTTASYATSASQAISASYAPLGTPTSYNPSYVKIDDVNYTSSSPYTVNDSVPSMIYVSMSGNNGQGNQNNLGLVFSPLSGKDGKIVTFNIFFEAANMDANNVFITSSGVSIFGLNNNSIGAGNDATLNSLTTLNNIASFDFQYLEGGGATGMTQGWYFISREGS
jgi:hypothetical protein